jgi:hypothetical protein
MRAQRKMAEATSAAAAYPCPVFVLELDHQLCNVHDFLLSDIKTYAKTIGPGKL